jgi:hypothetical protein
MTTAEIIVYIKDNYAYDNDLANHLGTTPTDAQLVPYINWAVRLIARRIKQLSINLPITLVAGQNTYSLNGISPATSSQVTRIHRCYINNYPLKKANRQNPGLWSFDEIERFNPSYKSADNGTPVGAAQVGNSLVLYPAPDASTVSGGNNFLVAEYLPDDLSTTDLTQSPDLPLELHEAIAYLAANRVAIPQITEAESLARMQLYNQLAYEAIDYVKKQNEASIQDFGTKFGYRHSRFMRV